MKYSTKFQAKKRPWQNGYKRDREIKENAGKRNAGKIQIGFNVVCVLYLRNKYRLKLKTFPSQVFLVSSCLKSALRELNLTILITFADD